MGPGVGAPRARSFQHDPGSALEQQAKNASGPNRVSRSSVRHAPAVANHNVLEAIGRRIAELRNQAGFTQEQLAAALDVSHRHLQRIEQGRINSTALSLARLAEVLGVELAEVFMPSSHVRRVGRPRKHKAAPAKKPAAPAKPAKAKPATGAKAKPRPAAPAKPAKRAKAKAKPAAKKRRPVKKPAAPPKAKPAAKAKAKARPAAPPKPAKRSAKAKAKPAAKKRPAKPADKKRPAKPKAKRPRKR